MLDLGDESLKASSATFIGYGPRGLGMNMDLAVTEGHLCNMGRMIEEMESKLRNSLDQVIMSGRRNNYGKSPARLDLKLNLSLPTRATTSRQQVQSPSPSPPSSCVSSESAESLRLSNSPEATSMILVGCPRCL
ncbi:hypothetical protein GIB67_020431, partial [Kingdonia uniflora]